MKFAILPLRGEWILRQAILTFYRSNIYNSDRIGKGEGIMGRRQWHWALCAPILLILLLIAFPARSRTKDAVEGLHFTTIGRTDSGAYVRINRHIVDTRQFARLFGTDMFRIRRDNPTKTLALCRVDGGWQRARVRSNAIEADRASDAYWDTYCPNEADRYVYLIPRETLIMTESANSGSSSSVDTSTGTSSTPLSAVFGSGSPSHAGAGDPLAEQIQACTTPKCVWSIVSPLAPNVRWEAPAARVDPLAKQIEACDTQRCVLDLVIPVNSRVGWRNIIVPPGIATVANDPATEAPAPAPLASGALPNAPSGQEGAPSGNASELENQLIELENQLIKLESQRQEMTMWLVLTLVLFAVTVVVLVRKIFRRREEVEDLRREFDSREERIRFLVQESQKVGRDLATTRNECSEIREVSNRTTGTLQRNLTERAEQIEDLRAEIRVAAERAAQRDDVIRLSVEGLCLKLGIGTIGSTEEGLRRMELVLGRIGEMLKRGWLSVAIEKLRLSEEGTYTLEELLQHTLSALPRIQEILTKNDEEAVRLRKELLELKRGGSSWGERFLAGANALIESNRGKREIEFSQEEFDALQALMNAITLSTLFVCEDGDRVSVIIQDPPVSEPPRSQTPHLRAVKT